MTSGSISINRINIAMEPPILDWLRYEARFFGTTIPAVIRLKLRKHWEDLPPDWREKLRK